MQKVFVLLPNHNSSENSERMFLCELWTQWGKFVCKITDWSVGKQVVAKTLFEPEEETTRRRKRRRKLLWARAQKRPFGTNLAQMTGSTSLGSEDFRIESERNP
jgi:hypothetical protein